MKPRSKRFIAAITALTYLNAPGAVFAADPLGAAIQGLQGLGRILNTIAPPKQSQQQPAMGQRAAPPLQSQGSLFTSSKCEMVVEFDQFGNVKPCMMPPPNPATYRLEDPAYQQAARAQLDQIVNVLQAKHEIDALDAARLVEAARPFLVALENSERAKSAAALVIPPGDTRILDFESYCLDYGMGPPATTTALALQPASSILPPAATPMYQRILDYRRANPQADYQVAQNLIHTLTEAGRGTGLQSGRLNDLHAKFMNNVYPGGASDYEQVVASIVRNYQALTPQQRQQLAQQRSEQMFMPPGQHPPYQPRKNDLAQGVSADAQDASGSANKIRVRFQNSSPDAYRFTTSAMAAVPAGGQRLGLQSALALPKLSPQATAFSQAALADSARKLADVTFKDAGTIVPMLLTHSGAVKGLVSTLPWVGMGIATWEGVTGKDIFTGEVLSPAQRLVALAGVIPGERAIQGFIAPVAGPVVASLAKYTATTADVAGVLVSDSLQSIDPMLFSQSRILSAVKDSLDGIASGAGVPNNIAASVRANMTSI